MISSVNWKILNFWGIPLLVLVSWFCCQTSEICFCLSLIDTYYQCPKILAMSPIQSPLFPYLFSSEEWLILNRGGEICSLLQTGQRPGVLRRVRFLKEKPHCLQEAGSAVRRLGCTDFAICSRWSRASLSLIPNNFEISRKSRHCPSKASAIFFLKVNIFCRATLYTLRYALCSMRCSIWIGPTFLWMTSSKNRTIPFSLSQGF